MRLFPGIFVFLSMHLLGAPVVAQSRYVPPSGAVGPEAARSYIESSLQVAFPENSSNSPARIVSIRRLGNIRLDLSKFPTKGEMIGYWNGYFQNQIIDRLYKIAKTSTNKDVQRAAVESLIEFTSTNTDGYRRSVWAKWIGDGTFESLYTDPNIPTDVRKMAYNEQLKWNKNLGFSSSKLKFPTDEEAKAIQSSNRLRNAQQLELFERQPLKIQNEIIENSLKLGTVSRAEAEAVRKGLIRAKILRVGGKLLGIGGTMVLILDMYYGGKEAEKKGLPFSDGVVDRLASGVTFGTIPSLIETKEIVGTALNKLGNDESLRGSYLWNMQHQNSKTSGTK